MNDAATPSAKPGHFSIGRVLIVAIPLVVIVYLVFQIVQGNTNQATAGSNGLSFDDIHNLNNPVVNTLDTRYTDADSDMVADAPADTAAWLNPDTLVFSFIAEEEAEAEAVKWAVMTTHLSQKLGRPVEYRAFVDRNEQLKAIRDGQVHLVGLNSGSVPIAVNAAGFVPVCTLGTDQGILGYTMQIVVPADGPIQTITDLKGKTLTLTQPTSNSGFKAPIVMLRDKYNIKPGYDCQVVYSYGHDQSIAQLAAGECQAIAVASDLFERAAKQGIIDPAKTKVLYTSERYTQATLGYPHNLDPELAAAATEALMSFDWVGTPLESELGGHGATRFVAVSYADDFQLIRNIDDKFGKKHTIE